MVPVTSICMLRYRSPPASTLNDYDCSSTNLDNEYCGFGGMAGDDIYVMVSVPRVNWATCGDQHCTRTAKPWSPFDRRNVMRPCWWSEYCQLGVGSILPGGVYNR
ncbi:hypothetical protein OK016_22315 [Vibrio chagasii]|nr:hypothetical protein [Vibrio chagasii]